MSEHEPDNLFDESFNSLELARQRLERVGYHYWHVPREHAEALVTAPLLLKIRSAIKRRGFIKIASHGIITFSGFADDPRELFQIPEARRYWTKLDQDLPELPALLAVLPQFGFNGAGLHLSFLGEVDEMRPVNSAVYNLHIKGTNRLLDQSLTRIKRAGQKYRLPLAATAAIMANFLGGVSDIEPL